MPRLHATTTEIEKHLAALEATARRIAACTATLDATRLNTVRGKREWSPVQILAHLRACDDVWTHSIYAMLAQEHPALPLLDPRRWAKATRYATLDFHVSFKTFSLRRAELLRVLRELPFESWTRSAMIEGRTHNVFSQVRRMVLHETEHCEQIELLVK